jgi:hypothetical protein
MPTREDHLEAAKLAKMVGSQLNIIDSFHLERSQMRANRININDFIAQVTDPNGRERVGNSSGYVPEELVRKMVPDAVPNNAPVAPVAPVAIQQADPYIPPLTTQQEVNPIIQIASTQNDSNILNKIAESVESIAKSLSKYVDYVTVSSTMDDKSKQTVLNE